MTKRLLILTGGTMAALLLFLTYDMNYEIFDYAIGKRLEKVISMALVACAIGSATLAFQSFTNNRILTPSILGLDSIYVLFQLLTLLFLGSESLLVTNPYVNFAMSALLMVGFSLILYRYVFSKAKSMYMVVLVGVVMGTFFTSVNGMLQIMVAPDVFNMILNRLFANFNLVNEGLIGISAVLIGGVMVLMVRKRHVMDVLALGRDQAINLGLSYEKEVIGLLVMVFLLVAIATALVGPITFLGFFAVNIARNYTYHHHHGFLMVATVQVAFIALLVGQTVVEHVFRFGLPVSVIISLVGGSYFIYMLLKENRA